MDHEAAPLGDSTSGAPAIDENNSEAESQLDPQEPTTAPDGISKTNYVIPEVTNSGPVNCAQKEVGTGRILFVELDEDGYYSSEPEAEETEWETRDEGNTSSESPLESEESCDSYGRSLGGQDARSEDEKLAAQVKDIQLWLHDSTEDLANMLSVIRSTRGYSEEFSTPNALGVATLESLLKLAIRYNHTHLKEYAIKHLDELSLTTIQRFRLARDCDILEWQLTSMEELFTRDEPITKEEASVLGFEVFSEIAAKREKMQYERGKHDGRSQVL